MLVADALMTLSSQTDCGSTASSGHDAEAAASITLTTSFGCDRNGTWLDLRRPCSAEHDGDETEKQVSVFHPTS
jgi:hypothetical protein